MIKFTWECVAILLGYEKQDNDTLKRMLADASLLNKMQNMDYDHVPLNIQKKVKQKIQSNENFKPEVVANIQAAAKSIVSWVRAVSDFTEIANQVEVKSKNVNEMSAQLHDANEALRVKQEQLAVVQKKVDDLETQLRDNIKEKERLDNEIQLTQERLIRAGELTQGLADEQIRWKEKVEELTEDLKKLIGDVFISAASVVYTGPFTGAFRYNNSFYLVKF